uniref:NADH dehydrogenase subunit 6 n=1 Tax=Sternocampsus coriaceus TaxID=3041292 RepID=UPI002551D506|nr:NADH dehydrogenase subunit 6 [Sternocampsus coriaceus]WGF20852.1 NADH dehydrogenase subunit 6 [Sternocampsus coriaceus]
MILLLMALTLITSLTFIALNHPLSMGLTLLIQTTLIALITGMLSHNFWFSYILFMIMIGGMLVLFIYMTSVASNEKFHYSPKLLIIILLMMTFSILLNIPDSFLNYQNSMNIDQTSMNFPLTFNMSLSKFLNYPSNMIMIMMIIYLLITLIAVVKITNIQYGPLRQKF